MAPRDFFSACIAAFMPSHAPVWLMATTWL